MAVTVVSWNIAKKHEPWRQLLQMDADVALLQEASPPPDDVVQLRDATLPPLEGASTLDIGPRKAWDSHSWNSHWWRGRWSALYDRWPMVVRLSDRVDIEWFKQVGPIGWPEQDEIAVSGIGTIAAARITPRDGSTEPFIAISMYGRGSGRIRASGPRGALATPTPPSTASSRTSPRSSATRTHRRIASWPPATSTSCMATAMAGDLPTERHATGLCSRGWKPLAWTTSSPRAASTRASR